MTTKKFNLYNRLVCAAVTAVAAVTYLLTMESGASFWDCGEFIASSYKLEVGHPPGNPVFQLFARIFTMPFSGRDAAIAVNALSALCSAATILLLYLTTVFFAKRLLKTNVYGEYSTAKSIAIMGSGAVAALAYTFSDTFWFSAVEGEVYAMSSLFTALVLWAMTKWYEQADKSNSSRWIVLISLLMGLSTGVHLLNLLMIPILVFMYFFRQREKKPFSMWELLGILALGGAIVGLLTFVIIPYLPKVAAYVDLFAVNVLGLPFNVGAAFFVLALFGLGFAASFITLKKGMATANTVALCSIALLFGYSIFCICVIRSNAKTPTNEYQPDNPFTLVRYLSREQYGKTPLLYGQYFGADYETEPTEYWTPMNGRYISTNGQPDVKYSNSDKMLFPRMYSSASEHINFYNQYSGRSKAPMAQKVKDKNGRERMKYRKPTFTENMSYFIDYQMHWMYWRYFMWNFAGRQNDYHSTDPADAYRGNWESGITVLDNLRLGDQSGAPDYLKNNKGKNHYYLLPLLLGLLGLLYQCSKDQRGAWLTFLAFFMTGIAIVLYLNQTPGQVRERDYAYAGSFYAYSIWIGLGVAGLYGAVKSLFVNLSNHQRTVIATAVTVLSLGVPVIMAAQNWDDHNRHNRNTAVEMAWNYLNSVGPNGILVTHGDNDTFPLWYAQEVEDVRTDVRICNTSLLGTDWHIDQMKYACNESAPLPLSVPLNQYLYGTNEAVVIGRVMSHYDYEAIQQNATEYAYSMISGMEFESEQDKKDVLYAHFDTYMDEAQSKKRAGEWVTDFAFNWEYYEKEDFEYPQGIAYPKPGKAMPISAVMDVFKSPRYTVDESEIYRVKGSTKKLDYLCARKISIPVNKENAIKAGIVSAEYADLIPSEMIITIPSGKNYITKQELFMLDLLSGYQWDRPINMLSMGGDINIGLKEYLMWQGTSYLLVPFKTGCKRGDPGLKNMPKEFRKDYALQMNDLIMNKFRYDNISRTDWFVDYQNLYTFCGVMSYRDMFYQLSVLLGECGLKDEAEAALDKGQEVMKAENFPLDMACLMLGNENAVLHMIAQYYDLGAEKKAKELADSMKESLLKSKEFFPMMGSGKYGFSDHEYVTSCLETLYELTGEEDPEHAADADEKVDEMELAVFAVQKTRELYESGELKDARNTAKETANLLVSLVMKNVQKDDDKVRECLERLQNLVEIVDEKDKDEAFADGFYKNITDALGL